MDTRKKIILKASEMFLKHGYDNTPMSQLAKELGLSKAGLYHHYQSKEVLLFDVIDFMNETNFMPYYREAKKISDPEERLLYFLRKFCEMNTTNASARIAVHEASRLTPQHHDKIKKFWQMAYELLKEAISEMQASGKAKKMNSAYAALAAIGMYSWIYYWFDYSRKDSDEELSETLVEIFMRGIVGKAQ
jgi:AcrR family transcriptional regulator